MLKSVGNYSTTLFISLMEAFLSPFFYIVVHDFRHCDVAVLICFIYNSAHVPNIIPFNTFKSQRDNPSHYCKSNDGTHNVWIQDTRETKNLLICEKWYCLLNVHSSWFWLQKHNLETTFMHIKSNSTQNQS